jgi:putative addiction module component (TIGR02574 family)
MARSLQELLREASQLSENERAELAGRLIQSLEGPPDPNVEATWAEEVERRIREIDEGKVETIPWEQVRAELFSRSRERG